MKMLPKLISSKREFLPRHSDLIALGLLVAIVTVANLVWIRQDARPMPKGDAYTYLTKTIQFINKIQQQSDVPFSELMHTLNYGGRPPLYMLLSLPLILLFGRSIDAALYVNIFFQVLLILSTYGLGRCAKNGRVGLLAALIVATYPPIVHHSHLYMPHFAVIACVALSLWLLLLLTKTRSGKTACLSGISLGFGMLTYPTFIYVLPVPTALVSLYLLLFQVDPKRPAGLKQVPGWLLIKLRTPLFGGLLLAALTAVGLSASWYLFEKESLSQHLQIIATSDVYFGYGFPDVPPSFWWYALTMPGAISNVFTLFLVIGLVAGVIKRRLFPFVLVITFVAAYVGFSLRKALGWSYFAPVLPIAAFLTADWFGDIRNKLLSPLLTAILVGVAVFNFYFVTWGGQSWSSPIATALGAPLNSGTCSDRFALALCPDPPQREEWQVSNVLQTVLDDPECQDRICSLMVVPKEKEFGFNRPSFNFYLAKNFLEHSIWLRKPTRAWFAEEYNLDGLLSSDYLVYIPEHTRGTEAPFTEFLRSPPTVFARAHQEVASFALPRGLTAKLIKRIKPLTVEEAGASVAVLDIPEEAKSQCPAILAGLYLRNAEQLWNEGETTQAIELLNRVIAERPSAAAWIRLGRVYAFEKEWKKSTMAYEQAVSLDPQHYWANHLLAGAYAKQGKWEAVVQLEQVAVEIAPRDIERVNSGVRLVEAYENLGDRGNACAMLQQVETWAEKGDERVEDLRTRLTCQK